MLVINLFILYFLSELCGAQDCVSKDYGNGGTVCVCTIEHCDTIPRPEKVQRHQYLKYTSNYAGLRFRQETGTFGPSEKGENIIIIKPEEKFQTILGWGGAFTDTTGMNINSLEKELQDVLLRSYFSEDGIEYSLCRVPIGGTDFSPREYSYDDGDVDDNLANFQLAPEDLKYKIPFMKKALDLTDGNLRFFGSAWTAPKWMKTNGEYNGPGYLLKNMYQAWADYFVKFLDSYQDAGLTFWGITTGNEPSVASSPALYDHINSVGWTSTDLGTWISNNLGPTIRNSKYSDTNIMILDDQSAFLPGYVEEAFENTTARQYIDGIAFHWYANSGVAASVLSETHNKFAEMFLLSSEACNGFIAEEEDLILGSWERGERYSADIIEDLWNWVGGWIDWNMVLDVTGGPSYGNSAVDSPIIVNATASEFYKQPMYYHLGHFSKFVPRDSTRISTLVTFDENVMVVAFERPDKGTAVILLNRNDEVVPISIIDSSQRIAEMELSEKSITTILYW